MATVYYYSGGSNTAPYDTWAKAATTMATAIGAMVAGDTLAVANDTASELLSAVTTWTFPGTITSPCLILCVDRGVASGWTSTDLRTMTNPIGTTGAGNTLGITGPASAANIFYGINFQTGTSTNNASMTISSATVSQFLYFSNCTFKLNGTGTTQHFIFSSSSANITHKSRFESCSFIFSATAQTFQFLFAQAEFIGCNIATTGTVPTTLIPASTANNKVLRVRFEGCDLSAFTSGNTIVGATTADVASLVFNNCRMNATLPTLSATQTVIGGDIVFSRTSGSGVVTTLAKYGLNGSHAQSTTVVRNGGYSDPASTAVGWQITTGSACKRYVPFECVALSSWLAAGTYTVTIYGILNDAAVPNTDEIWTEFSYLGNASYPLSTTVRDNDAVPFVLNSGAARDADTSDWDNGATARANSTAYSLGDIIKVSTNTGRIFFCTTAGTSNGSEPAGYASAVDGGSVTDGTAVFRAGCRFKMSQSITTALAGPVTAKVFAGKASFAQLYIDPKIDAV